jgi:ribosomal protein RSM22 (predicted rRNA methylase)
MVMPRHVKSALDALLVGVSRKDLAARSALMTDAYRGARPSAAAVADLKDALAYAVARMPATYAATWEALSKTAERHPRLQPRTMLDLGSGPGTASLAALEMWPALERVTMLEGLQAFRDLAAEFVQAVDATRPTQAQIVAADLLAGTETWPEADLVMAAYVLVELPEARVPDLVLNAYNKARQALLLIEPGTPAGFARIRVARDALVERGAALIAPCPHTRACPMMSPDWCHFSVRLPRSRDHKLAKAADVPFEDERFSYLAVTRSQVAAADGERVIAPARVSKGEIVLRTCTDHGLANRRISRRDRLEYKAAKRLGWGDILRHNIGFLSKTP